MAAKHKESPVKAVPKENKAIQFNDVISFTDEPDTNIFDSWNQITLSLASNGGYTLQRGSKFILYVYMEQKIDDKKVLGVKPFLVSKNELVSLQNEANEFRGEIDAMLSARELEEGSRITVKEEVKPNPVHIVKKEDKKNIKDLHDILKKGLDSIKSNNKKVVVEIPPDMLMDDIGDEDIVEDPEPYDNL